MNNRGGMIGDLSVCPSHAAAASNTTAPTMRGARVDADFPDIHLLVFLSGKAGVGHSHPDWLSVKPSKMQITPPMIRKSPIKSNSATY